LLQAIFRCSKPLHCSREFLERGSNRGPLSWRMWATASKGKQTKAAAGAQTPLAAKHFADFSLAVAHFCCCLFSCLGFRFRCIVLRVANDSDLIIDLRRLCNLQLKLTRKTALFSESDPSIYCTLSSQLSKPLLGAEFLLLNSSITLTPPWNPV
jgi:hypothetical protein